MKNKQERRFLIESSTAGKTFAARVNKLELKQNASHLKWEPFFINFKGISVNDVGRGKRRDTMVT